MEKILLIGAGALARDLIDGFGAERFIAAYVDAEFAKSETIDGVPICTDLREAVRLATHYLLATSSIPHREQAVEWANGAGLSPASPLFPPTARIAKSASLGRGCVVGHFSTVGPSARLDDHSLVMHGAVIGHDSVVEGNVVICAGTNIGGYARVRARTFVGTNAVVAPHVTIGEDSSVAAGAACLRDAPRQSRLIGNPARRVLKA